MAELNQRGTSPATFGHQSTPGRRSWQDRLGDQLPKIVVAPAFIISMIFVYGFIAWTMFLSVSTSRLRPRLEFAGFAPYEVLWQHPVWHVALNNLAIFGILYIGLCIVIGLFLAILIDQKIRSEGFFRTIYLYPMALSFVVTGVAWQWFLNPRLGLQSVVRDLGWETFRFDWLISSDMAIYCVVIAGVWQSSGFIMAMFLAGLRGVSNEVISAAKIDGASTVRIYWRIVIPQLRPVFLASVVVLGHLAIKSFDLVIALTGGGPGFSTELPATFMYNYTFTRNQMAIGAASAIMMLMIIATLIVPYLWSELRHQRRSDNVG